MSASGEDTTVVNAPQPTHGDGSAEKNAAGPASVSNTTLIFFAAGSLVVFIVALVTLFG
jgi:hypothetical protein